MKKEINLLLETSEVHIRRFSYLKRKSIHIPLLMVLFMILILPKIANATYITEGFIHVSPDSRSFSFSGFDFSASGTFYTSTGWHPFMDLIYSKIDINGGVCCNDMFGGPATISGTSYEYLAWGGLQAMGGVFPRGYRANDSDRLWPRKIRWQLLIYGSLVWDSKVHRTYYAMCCRSAFFSWVRYC